MNKSLIKKGVLISLILSAGLLLSGYFAQKELLMAYLEQNSVKITDRNGQEIFILQNKKGNFARYSGKIPEKLKGLLVKKEDKYFYYHFGFNPFSVIGAIMGRFGPGQRKASSTISQQLVKILLQKESERNIKNKLVESFYTLALETFKSKGEILKMYANSIYFGNQAQGINEACLVYFGTDPELLTDGQVLQLLAAVSSPTENNPTQNTNTDIAISLGKKLGINTENIMLSSPSTVKGNMSDNPHSDNLSFELQFLSESDSDKQLTIDKKINEKVREIVKRNIEKLQSKNANNGAVIIIKLPENEILSLVGSPDPKSENEGYKINMLNEPRPIGSTIKPFIYLKAFEGGLRPYTLVDDREYKYITALGFPLYPKNFDYQYRGKVSLHYSLSNSLNVPSVKVLEYVGLQSFYNFLENDLGFKPIQALENYQLGIALGALEMDLTSLAKYFTIFPNKGTLKDIKIYSDPENSDEKNIADPMYIQLVNKILNDRKTGIEQFGLKSDLNLYQNNYALKTGTSRDFKDSWVVGYTPDFLVGVWVGNADNSPTQGVSGQIGAGNIWSEVMELLLGSEYNKKTPFDFSSIAEFNNGNNEEYGLKNDDYEKKINILLENDSSLILNPHDGDSFLLEEKTKIILLAKEKVKWFIDGILSGESESQILAPQKGGQIEISAEGTDGKKEKIVIYIQD
jgi:penicillin-binding protein 1C